jgi:hypothetical protein
MAVTDKASWQTACAFTFLWRMCSLQVKMSFGIRMSGRVCLKGACAPRVMLVESDVATRIQDRVQQCSHQCSAVAAAAQGFLKKFVLLNSLYQFN